MQLNKKKKLHIGCWHCYLVMSLLQLSILMADSLCYPKDVLSSLGTIACVCRFLVDSYVNESRSISHTWEVEC